MFGAKPHKYCVVLARVYFLVALPLRARLGIITAGVSKEMALYQRLRRKPKEESL